MNERSLVDEFHSMILSILCWRHLDFNHIMPKSERMILACLLKKKRNRRLTISQLASELQISNPAISRTVGNLADKGWVSREVDGDDRRIIYIQATQKGQEKFNELIKEIRERLNKVFNQFSREEIEEFIKTGNKIAEAMKENEQLEEE